MVLRQTLQCGSGGELGDKKPNLVLDVSCKIHIDAISLVG